MNAHRKTLWIIAQTLVASALLLDFFLWLPWVDATPIAELPRSMAAMPLPTGCLAANIEHGRPVCQWLGSVDSNLPLFVALTAFFFLGAAFLLFTGHTKRGLGFGSRFISQIRPLD